LKTITVSALNIKIKTLLEEYLMHVSVVGEVASVTYHGSGHLYFSIKDDKSTLKCVMWRSSVSRLKFRLEKGEKIVVNGSVGVYTPRGEYQLIATDIEPFGKGSLALAFEQMKERLGKKGYFDSERKKSIPPYPGKIALVTASGGAALQDMLRVAERRWPLCDMVVVDVLVQGETAAFEIARGIEMADTLGVDLIVVGRGGGSVEDLWAFNEEEVADAIFGATTPVVSAVGHEVDTVISDLVADLRAPTPSAAMEMVLPDMNEILYALDESYRRMEMRMRQIVALKEEALSRESANLERASVATRLEEMEESFDRLSKELNGVMEFRLSGFDSLVSPLEHRLKEAVHLSIGKKEREVQSILSTMKMNDPASRSRDGWAEITSGGKRTPLSSIAIDEEFDMFDGKVKLRARCIGKEELDSLKDR